MVPFSQFKDSLSIDYMYIRYVSTFLFGVVVDQIVKGNPPIGGFICHGLQ